jgi:hypothetical protein
MQAVALLNDIFEETVHPADPDVANLNISEGSAQPQYVRSGQ